MSCPRRRRRSARRLPSPLTVALLIAALSAVNAAAQQSFDVVRFEPPLPAPPFQLPDRQRRTVRLSDYRGGYVLLNFWATWCPPCVKEMPSLQRLDDRYDALTVVAVAVDDADTADRIDGFVERLALTFPILLDPHSEVADVYGAGALPSTFLVDPQGRVIAAAKGERDWFSDQAREFFERTLEP